MNANGILVQGLNEKTHFVKNFTYSGINAFFQFPLSALSDIKSRELTKLQRSTPIGENGYSITEFISDIDLYKRYAKRCSDLNIEVRSLFIESDYAEECWSGALPELKLLGYEYCPIPIDEQIITDLDWYHPFSKFWDRLNQFGLFQSYEAAKNFAYFYDKAFRLGEIGDGEMSAYICKVSQLL